MDQQVNLQTIQDAYLKIKPFINKTPVFTCSTLDNIASENAQSKRKLYFKCENFQKVGAFKFRGAMNAILSLESSKGGVVTHSRYNENNY